MIYDSLNERNIKQVNQIIRKTIIAIVILSLLIIVDFVLIYFFQTRENMNLFIFIGSLVLFISSTLILYFVITTLVPNKNKLSFLNKCKQSSEKITGTVIKEEGISTKDFIEYSTYLVSISEEKSLKILVDINAEKLKKDTSYNLLINNQIAFYVEEVL